MPEPEELAVDHHLLPGRGRPLGSLLKPVRHAAPRDMPGPIDVLIGSLLASSPSFYQHLTDTDVLLEPPNQSDMSLQSVATATSWLDATIKVCIFQTQLIKQGRNRDFASATSVNSGWCLCRHSHGPKLTGRFPDPSRLEQAYLHELYPDKHPPNPADHLRRVQQAAVLPRLAAPPMLAPKSITNQIQTPCCLGFPIKIHACHQARFGCLV